MTADDRYVLLRSVLVLIMATINAAVFEGHPLESHRSRFNRSRFYMEIKSICG